MGDKESVRWTLGAETLDALLVALLVEALVDCVACCGVGSTGDAVLGNQS
jgi:hypothetical protein